MYFFGLLWHHWSLGFKISMPILYTAFMAAQLYGSRIFYVMWRRQEAFIGGKDDLENGLGLQEEGIEIEEEGRGEDGGGEATQMEVTHNK